MINLKNIRKKSGITQQQLADALGIPRSTLTHYESGRSEMGYALLTRISDYFAVSVDEILGHSPQLFDDARVNRPEVIELFDKLTSRQKEIVLERMRTYIDANEETRERQQSYTSH